MRPLTPAILLLASVCPAQERSSLPERFLRQEEAAFEHYRRKAWTEAVAAFEKQIAIYDENPRPYYNIACCYALQGDADRAATWLRLSIARGWRNREHLEADPDFDSVRESEAYKGCLETLDRTLRGDPDPLPRLVPPSDVPAATNARAILFATAVQDMALQTQEALLEESQLRRWLFPIYDRRMAMLTRYLAENGDARDADVAAHARVQTAMLYLARADEDAGTDEKLRELATRHVLAASEEFVRGWAGSPLAPDVLFLRAYALSRTERLRERGEDALESLIADHPDSDAARRARVELCVLLADKDDREQLASAYADLERRAEDDELLRILMRGRLWKARLLAKGLTGEGLEKLAGDASGPALYVFVSANSTDCERELAALRNLDGEKVKVVAIAVDDPDRIPAEQVEAWMKVHAAGLASVVDGRRLAVDLRIGRVPTLILVRGSEVLAVDPTDTELVRLLK